MMTRKDFEAIAEILAKNKSSRGKGDAYTFNGGTVEDLADYLQASNPRFDRARFMEAVGL